MRKTKAIIQIVFRLSQPIHYSTNYPHCFLQTGWLKYIFDKMNSPSTSPYPIKSPTLVGCGCHGREQTFFPPVVGLRLSQRANG